jgi:aryl-alcohol dehydrogenase-like predicted oxidoreductase
MTFHKAWSTAGWAKPNSLFLQSELKRGNSQTSGANISGNRLGNKNYQAEPVLIQLEESLQALQTDHIDTYQLHSAEDEWFDNDELWTMLDRQVQAGEIHFLGNSIGRPNMQYQLRKSTEFGMSVIQAVYNAINYGAAKFVLPVARELDLDLELAREAIKKEIYRGFWF